MIRSLKTVVFMCGAIHSFVASMVFHKEIRKHHASINIGAGCVEQGRPSKLIIRHRSPVSHLGPKVTIGCWVEWIAGSAGPSSSILPLVLTPAVAVSMGQSNPASLVTESVEG